MGIGKRILMWVLALLAAGISIIILAAVVLAVLIGTGGVGKAGECKGPDGADRTVANDPALAEAWQTAWDGFNSQLDGGTSSSMTFDESQATSRANRFIEDRNVPVVRDVTVCFHAGEAEARGTVEVPVFSGFPVLGGLFDSEAKITGTMDLSGAHPRINITNIDVGNVPGVIADSMDGRIESAVNDKLVDMRISHVYTLTFAESEATIAGSP